MKTHACEQGSREWYQLRLGRPTASNFNRIITPAKGDLSKQAVNYMYELAFERLTGAPYDNQSSAFMSRGTEMEEEARRWYEWQYECDIEQVGFVTTDDGRYGCSPDGIIGGHSGWEVKCPSGPMHLRYLDRPDLLLADYRTQVLGSLMVSAFEYWVVVSYNPDFPAAVVMVVRDADYILRMAAALDQFCDDLDAAMDRLKAAGCVLALPSVPVMCEASGLDARVCRCEKCETQRQEAA